MKTLNDVIADVEAQVATQQATLADLQALAASAPAVSPAQASVVNETITLSNGNVLSYDETGWKETTSSDSSSTSTDSQTQ